MKRFRNTTMTAVLGVCSLGIALAGLSGEAKAQFPEEGLELIVVYGAGGGTDVTARMLAGDLEDHLGQSVTVQNVTGGGGWVGWSTLAAAEPDGYTIGYVNVPNIYAGYLDPQYERDESLESFTPLMNHVTDYCVWAVPADSPYESISDVVEAAQENPGTVSITAHGHGNDDHLAIMAVEDATGAEFTVTHNDSTADSIAQVLGGHVDVLGANVSEVFQQHADGELRVLGVMAPNRSEFLEDVPTFEEQGYDQYWSVSRGIAGPAELPDDVANTLIDALEATFNSEAHREAATDLGLSLEQMKGEEYRDFLVNTEQEIKQLMGW